MIGNTSFIRFTQTARRNDSHFAKLQKIRRQITGLYLISIQDGLKFYTVFGILTHHINCTSKNKVIKKVIVSH